MSRAERDSQRLGELLGYMARNIALPDNELAEVELLAARLGVALEWRHVVLGDIKQYQGWQEGRYTQLR